MGNAKTSRVFVTQEARTGRIDYSPARDFGTLKFITIMDFSSDDESIQNKVLVDEIRTALRDFDIDNDFIVMTGSPLVTAAVFMILRERTHIARVLRWSNQSHTYTPVTINLQ